MSLQDGPLNIQSMSKGTVTPTRAERNNVLEDDRVVAAVMCWDEALLHGLALAEERSVVRHADAQKMPRRRVRAH